MSELKTRHRRVVNEIVIDSPVDNHVNDSYVHRTHKPPSLPRKANFSSRADVKLHSPVLDGHIMQPNTTTNGTGRVHRLPKTHRQLPSDSDSPALTRDFKYESRGRSQTDTPEQRTRPDAPSQGLLTVSVTELGQTFQGSPKRRAPTPNASTDDLRSSKEREEQMEQTAKVTLRRRAEPDKAKKQNALMTSLKRTMSLSESGSLSSQQDLRLPTESFRQQTVTKGRPASLTGEERNGQVSIERVRPGVSKRVKRSSSLTSMLRRSFFGSGSGTKSLRPEDQMKCKVVMLDGSTQDFPVHVSSFVIHVLFASLDNRFILRFFFYFLPFLILAI